MILILSCQIVASRPSIFLCSSAVASPALFGAPSFHGAAASRLRKSISRWFAAGLYWFQTNTKSPTALNGWKSNA